MTFKKKPIDIKTIMDTFDVSASMAATLLAVGGLIVACAIVYFIHSAPPTTLTISAGPEGSIFQKNALAYAKILEANGVKVKVQTSEGSIQNLRRLEDENSKVDVGIVQAGITVPGQTPEATEQLVSLGSISHQPLLIFYRGKPIKLLSELAGKKIATGAIGSGTQQLATAILKLNNVTEEGKTQFLELDPAQAAKALLAKDIDVAFIMSEAASVDILRSLIHSEEVRLYSFKQVAAYTRKLDSMDPLLLPEGAIDIGKNIPSEDVSLMGPMVELVARNTLHPALSDVLLEAASQVHARAGLFQSRGEFPAPIEHSILISDDANRYYKSGKTFWYRFLPFWLASLMSRIVVVFIPTIVILVPILKIIPAFFRWKTQIRIYQHYRELLGLEHRYLSEKDPKKRDHLRKDFDRIEEAVNKMKVKSKYADQVFGLRGHIDYVRRIVQNRSEPAATA